MEFNKSKKIKILSVMGPTASGKTNLSVSLAKEFSGEIINADSMQVYKEMKIGTARPSKKEMQNVPHYLLGSLSVCEDFNVARFVSLAKELILKINSGGKLPIVCGGTGLYINNLILNNDFFSQKENLKIREKLEKELKEKGINFLLLKLKRIDPKSYKKLHKNDIRRIIRALEIYYSSGKTKTQQNYESKKKEKIYDVLKIGLKYNNRAKLYQKINQRVDKMLDLGIEKEARHVLSLDCSKTSSYAIGYKEFLPYFKNEISLSEAVKNIKRETRRYAKRQLTWFLKDKEINWFDVEDDNVFLKSKILVEDFLKKKV